MDLDVRYNTGPSHLASSKSILRRLCRQAEQQQLSGGGYLVKCTNLCTISEAYT